MILCTETEQPKQKTTRKRPREAEAIFQPRKQQKQGVEIRFQDATFSTLYTYLFRYGSYFKTEYSHKPSIISHDSLAGRFGDVLRYLECPYILKVKKLDTQYLKEMRNEADRFDIPVLKSKVNREILSRQYPDCFRIRFIEGSGSSMCGSFDVSKALGPLEGIYTKIDTAGEEDRPGYGQKAVKDHFFYYEGDAWCFNITVGDYHPLKSMLSLLPMKDYGEIEIRSNPTSLHLTDETVGQLQNLVWSGKITNLESEKGVATLQNIRFKFELIHHAEFATQGPLFICSTR